MRAEAQGHIDRINAATALLRRFLDWDRALKRLDELNAKVEDSELWNDPKAAQEVMRERRRLDEAINATKAIERELSDTAELIEMAEGEGDQAMVDDGVRSLAELAARADRDKLMQIMLNLLSNAIKFTAADGAITVRCDADAGWVRVHVHDTGLGIPEDRLESIFDPFVQVDRALNRPHEGVGLGLSISRDLAHGMGGSLTVRSAPGAGSTFTLRLRRGEGD